MIDSPFKHACRTFILNEAMSWWCCQVRAPAAHKRAATVCSMPKHELVVLSGHASVAHLQRTKAHSCCLQHGPRGLLARQSDPEVPLQCDTADIIPADCDQQLQAGKVSGAPAWSC